MKILTSKDTFGFTLVELLVVIGIIGVLTAVLTVNFVNAKKVARDNIRKTDLKSLELAINLYKAQNGHYPPRCPTYKSGTNVTDWSGNVHNTQPGEGYACNDGTTKYIKDLVSDYIAALPVDPKASSYAGSSNQGYLYMTDSLGTAYKLLANNSVESKFVTGFTDGWSRCPKDENKTYCNGTPDNDTYAVYSAGAESW